MYMFTRFARYNGPRAEVVEHALDVHHHTANKFDRGFRLWAAGLGRPDGTFFSFATNVEGLVDLADMSAKLDADAEYQAKVARGSAWLAAPIEEMLDSPLYGSIGATPPVGVIATMTQALIAGGAYQEAIEWSVDLAKYIETVADVRMFFLMPNQGPVGQAIWIRVAADRAKADAANAAMNADAGLKRRLGDVGRLFVEGSINRTLMTRIA